MMMVFLRMSSDGECIALFAAGYSLRRLLIPVGCVCILAFGMCGLASTILEAWGKRAFDNFVFRKTQTEVDNLIRFQIKAGSFTSDFLGYVFYTESISKDREQFTNVLLAPSPEAKKSNDFVLLAKTAKIQGSVEASDLRMIFFDGTTHSFDFTDNKSTQMSFSRAEIDLLQMFRGRILESYTPDDDFRGYPLPKLTSFVAELNSSSPVEARKRRRMYAAEYLLHSRVANPFLVFAFGMIGAILGVRDPRQLRGSSYLKASGIVLGSFVLITQFRWLAENGYLVASAAAWIPQLLLLLAALFLVDRRSKLSLTENTWQLPKWRSPKRL